MLKLKKNSLPPLQPHLTGTNDTTSERTYKLNAVEELRRSRKCDPGGHGIPGVHVRNWAEQAQAVTDTTQPAGRSAATAAEIRLHEALHKCSLAAGEYSEHTNRPYRLRTAVCCKLLEEFAALAGPFSGILRTLCEELGGSSRMDQLPYYVVVSKLEAQNSALMSEQQEFRKQLGQQGTMLDEISSKLEKLAAALESANATNCELTLSQSALERREKVAQNELETAKYALASTNSSLQALTTETAHEREVLELKLAEAEQVKDAQKDELECVKQAVRTKEEEISQLHIMISGMVRQSEVQQLEVEARELANTVSEQSVELKQQKDELSELRCRTPRPLWPKLCEDMRAAGGLSPAEPSEDQQHQTSCQLAEQLSRRVNAYATSLQESKDVAKHLRHLLHADPTAAVAATAGCLDVPMASLTSDVFTSHGIGPFVPRMLRTDQKVFIRMFSQHDTIQSVLHILTHVPVTSPSLHDAIYNTWLATDVPLTSMPQIGYSFMASLQQYRSHDALIRLLHEVWLGKAPMHSLFRMAQLLQGLAKVLETLAKIKLEDSPCAGLFPKADFVQLIRKLCPSKSEECIGSLTASLSHHAEGGFVRVGDIHCGGVHCTEIFNRAEPCNLGPLNAFAQECRQVGGENGDQDISVQHEAPGEDSTAINAAEEADTEENSEQLEKLKDNGSAPAAAVDGDERDTAAAVTSDQVLDEPTSHVDVHAEKSGTCEGSQHTLPELLLQQHAMDLERLRGATWEAVCACDQRHWPEGDSLREIQGILEQIECMDHRAIPGCVDAWSRLPCPSTRESVASGLLASAPLQFVQDFGFAAADVWIHGLLGREDGCGSAAMLPEVV